MARGQGCEPQAPCPALGFRSSHAGSASPGLSLGQEDARHWVLQRLQALNGLWALSGDDSKETKQRSGPALGSGNGALRSTPAADKSSIWATGSMWVGDYLILNID